MNRNDEVRPSPAVLGDDASHNPELVHRVRAIVSRMAPELREVFLLGCLDDRRNDEIAEFLGIAIETVEERLADAVLHLARGLQEGRGPD